MKKSLKLLIASSAVLLGATCLSGCGNKEPMIPVASVHEHTFSSEWSSNEGSHWHAATCEHKDLMSDIADHSWGGWINDSQPTETEEGSEHRVCSVCKYTQTNKIAKLDHTHTFSDAWESDDNFHWHVATCHNNVKSELIPHAYGAWTVDNKPTEENKGSRSRKCSVCNHVQTEEIEVNPDAHTFANDWSYDVEDHWHAATCAHTDLRKDVAKHNFGDVEHFAGTTSEPAEDRQTCTVCGYHVHVHSFGNWIIDQQSTSTNPGSKHRVCDSCGFEETAALDIADHVHSFASTWSKDANYHWHASTCGHSEVADKEAHSSTSKATYTNSKTCDKCGYVMEENLYTNAIGMDGNEHSIYYNRPVQLFKINVYPQSNDEVAIRFRMETTGYGGPGGGTFHLKLISRSSNGTFSTLYDYGEQSIGASGSYFKHDYVTRMLPANTSTQYFAEVERINNGAGVLYVRLTNNTYEYEKVSSEYANISLENGGTSRVYFTHYRALNGVQHEYWKYTDQSGNVLGIYQDESIVKQPQVLADGQVKFSTNSGATISLKIPKTIYSTDEYSCNKAFYVDDSDDNYLWLGYNYYEYTYNLYRYDPIYGVPNLFTSGSIELQYWAMVYHMINVFDYRFMVRKPGYGDSQQFNCDESEYPFGLNDTLEYAINHYTNSNLTSPITMDYNASTRRFSFTTEMEGWDYSVGEWIRVLKVVNDKGFNFDKFISYGSASFSDARDPNKTNWAMPYQYAILDENYHEIAGYDQLFQSGLKKNADGDRVVLEPNHTYYILIKNWLAKGAFAVEQRKYSLTYHATDANVLQAMNRTEEFKETPYTERFANGGSVACARDNFSATVDGSRTTSGYVLTGYSLDSDLSKKKLDYLPNDSIVFGNNDIDLYAHYIPYDNVITTRYFCPAAQWGSNGNKLIIRTQLVDARLDPQINDGVMFHYKSGIYAEHYITDITHDSNGVYTIVFEPGSLASSTTYSMANVAWIELETEYAIDFDFDSDKIDDWDYEGYYGFVVDKGESVELPASDDYMVIRDGYYFDHWYDINFLENIYYDYTICKPTYNMWLVADIRAINGSGLLSKYNEFTVGENASGLYAEFKIKDDNAATGTLVSGASASNVEIILKDGTVYSDSVAKILKGNSTVTSATRADETIKVFFNGITREQLETAVMIRLAA